MISGVISLVSAKNAGLYLDFRYLKLDVQVFNLRKTAGKRVS
jgi:hypothetical protein